MATEFADWNERAIVEAAKRVMERRMTRVVLFVEGRVKALLARHQAKRRTRSGGFVGLEPSAPGEPPKMLTGALRSNIAGVVVVDALEVHGYVGVRRGAAAKYGRRLELGFVGRDAAGRMIRQAPRPYLRPGILQNARRIGQMLGGQA